MNFDTLFVNPNGGTSRGQYIPALLTVVAAIAFFAYLVTGRTAQFCILILLYPLFVLLARRLQDMGNSALLLFVPLALSLASMAVTLDYLSLAESLVTPLHWAALLVTVAFALWGCVKK